VSEKARVGIDIEKRKIFCFSDLADCLSVGEQKKLVESGNRKATFYDFWTMKESVLKADGRGLSVPMGQVVINDGCVTLDGATWFLTELDFGPDYSCHLATSVEFSAIEMKKVEFNQASESCLAGRLGHCLDCLAGT
jgi:4'-phosphopantetheinyl transferase